MKFLFILCFGFLNSFSADFSLKAAEKIILKFEGMSIPVSIDKLSEIGSTSDNSTEVSDWFRNNGLEKIFQLSKYLEFPVFKQNGFTQQILRSWIGKKFLSEISRSIIIVPNDINGLHVFNTIESLLEKNKEVSTLDILKNISIEVIKLDVDNLINIISSWKIALEEEQKLSQNLSRLKNFNRNGNFNLANEKYSKTLPQEVSLNVLHRDQPLLVESWAPKSTQGKDLIIFMPGLGGDISNFRWLGSGLSKRGWPVVIIGHKGSDASSLNAFIKGEEALPGGADIFLHRIKDLDAVINSHKQGLFGVKSKTYILMGHSLGSLISMLYEGNPPEKEFEERCDKELAKLAITNLSKFLQCQLLEISLPESIKSSDLKAIVGFNSFGSLIWPTEKSLGIDVPVLFIGGTFDLITPLLNEQSKVFFANKSNKLNRFLIIEGASHFSPIRVDNKFLNKNVNSDVFNIKNNFVGINPYDFQNLSLEIIIKFLIDLDQKRGINTEDIKNIENLNFHIMNKKDLKNLL